MQSPENLLYSKRLDLLARQLHVSGYLSIFVSSVFTWVMSDSGNTRSMIIWVIINAVIIFSRMPLFKKLKRLHEIRQLKNNHYHYILLFFILVSGVFWGIGLYLFTPDAGNQELFFTIIIAMTIMTVVSVPGLAVSIPACLFMIIPICIGMSLAIYDHEYIILFYTILASYLFLIGTTVRLNKVLIQALSLDIENEKLLRNITVEKEIAEQANIEKSHFLAAASHDLSQPLNSMGLFIYSLRKTLETKTVAIADKSKPVKILSQIDNSYRALKGLFDSLMEISRLDAGTMRAENKALELNYILTPLTDELRDSAESKGLTLEYLPVNCVVKSDPILLSRILRNLISNAIKYTHAGSITVRECIESNDVVINIIDSGIGIPAEEFKNIFNEYHQLSNKARDRRQGIGLGLSLVKKMSHLIGADISVASTLNKGSTFTLRLPLSTLAITEEETTPIKHITLDGVRVLIIDDEPDILQAMKLVLTDWGCEVELAENYQQADDFISNHTANNTPDIILCDYRLQETMTGVEVIKKIRTKLNREIPAIIISGDTNPALLKSINDAGLFVLSKPVQVSMLQAKMDELLSE
jgi:signal transduction histidine kinase/CheY-like chemotaxis protein